MQERARVQIVFEGPDHPYAIMGVQVPLQEDPRNWEASEDDWDQH